MPLYVGPWRVDRDNLEISLDGQVAHLPHKSMEVLLALAERAGTCVTRQELLDRVWKRAYVQDDVLTRTVADLRRALGDDGRETRFIATVPKRGYRMVAPVSASAPGHAVAAAVEDPPMRADAPLEPALEVRDIIVDAPPARRALFAAIAFACAAVIATAVFVDVREPGADAHVDALTQRIAHALPLTSEPGLEIQPRWTADGRTVVFVKIDDDTPRITRLEALTLDTLERRVLVDEGRRDYCPTPSPEGALFAWQRYDDAGGCTVKIRTFAGGGTVDLAACADWAGYPGCPEFTRDGRALIVSAAAHGGLARVDVDTGAATTLTSPHPQDGYDALPRRSPDGAWLAFERRLRYPLSEVRVMPLDGSGGERAVQAVRSGNYGLAWDPAGTALLLATDAIAHPALAWWPIDARAPRPLGARGARNPDVSKDGAIVFESAQYTGNVWLAERGGGIRQATRSLKHDALPAFSPSGDAILFVSNRSGAGAVWTYDVASGVERALPLPATSRWSRAHYGPDARRVIVTRADTDRYAVCVLTVLDGTVACPSKLAGRANGIELDDASLVVAVEGDDGWRLERYRPTDDALEPLLGSSVAKWDASGDVLAYQPPGEPRVDVVKLARDGATSIVSIELAAPDVLWTLHRSGVLTATRSSVGLHVRDHRFDGSVVADPFPVLPLLTGDIAASPDGSRIALSKTEALRIDLMVAEQ